MHFADSETTNRLVRSPRTVIMTAPASAWRSTAGEWRKISNALPAISRSSLTTTSDSLRH